MAFTTARAVSGEQSARGQFARLPYDLHLDRHPVDILRKAFRPHGPAGEVHLNGIVVADLRNSDAYQPGHVAETAKNLGFGLPRPIQ
jgi:hypothetical protein